MNRKNLVLITSGFPFDISESFLESEIKIISGNFEHIHIITQNTSSDKQRELPSNCSIHRINTNVNLKSIRFLLSSLISIFTCYFAKEIILHIKANHRLPTVSVLKDFFFVVCSGKIIYKSIKKVFKNEHLQCNDTILYSYWLEKHSFAAAKFLKKNKQCVGVSRAHNFDIYSWRVASGYQPLKWFYIKYLNAIYFCAEHGRNYFINNYLFDKKFISKLRINRLGVINDHDFKINVAKKNELFLVSCSYITKIKRINLIIKALSLIEDINIKWYHFGDNNSDKMIVDETKKMASSILSNKKNIVYEFKGAISNRELMRFYSENEIDIFINTSSIEGLPVSIMEAMSFGIPVIATNVGGSSEIVNKSNGILLSADPTEKEISIALNTLLKMSEKDFLIYRQNAFQTWQKHYNAKQNYNIFVEELSKL